MSKDTILIPISECPLVDISGRASFRAALSKAENKIKELVQSEVPVTHTFSKDVYAREIKISAGTLLVGKIHKHKNLNIISKGKVSFFSVDGTVHTEAPYTFVAEPGVKRVIYAHTDAVWTTIHGTCETDLEKIEDEFIAKDYSDVPGISDEEVKLIEEARKCLG